MPFLLFGDGGVLPTNVATDDLVKLFGAVLTALAVWILRVLRKANRKLDMEDKDSPVSQIKEKQDRHSERFTEFQTEVMKRLTSQDNAIEVVKKEVTENGGGSLKDGMIRVQSRVEALDVKFRLMISNIQATIWVADSKGLCTWASPPFLQMLHRDQMDIIGDNWRSIIWEPDRYRVVKEWDNSVTQGRSFRLQYRLVRGDGNIICIKVDATCMKTDKNVIIGWWAQVKSIGEPIGPDEALPQLHLENDKDS